MSNDTAHSQGQTSGYHSEFGYFYGPYALSGQVGELSISTWSSLICHFPVCATCGLQCGVVFRRASELRRHVQKIHLDSSHHLRNWRINKRVAGRKGERSAGLEALSQYVLSGSFDQAQFKSSDVVEGKAARLAKFLASPSYCSSRSEYNSSDLQDYTTSKCDACGHCFSRSSTATISRLSASNPSSDDIEGHENSVLASSTSDATNDTPYSDTPYVSQSSPRLTRRIAASLQPRLDSFTNIDPIIIASIPERAASSSSPVRQIYWVPHVLDSDIASPENKCISVPSIDGPKFHLSGSPYFSRAHVRAIRAQLGKNMASIRSTSVFLHQTVVIMKILQQIGGDAVKLMSLSNLCNAFKDTSISSAFHGSDILSTVIFLYWGTEPIPLQIREIYELFRQNHDKSNALRLYPSESEALFQNSKVSDIRALDEIAQRAPYKWRFRPITCFGHGPCMLKDRATTVKKRNNSSGGLHVKVIRKCSLLTDLDLTCTHFITTSELDTTPNDKDGHWFHQEFIDSFRDMGEMRVFIIARPHHRGLRGLRGYVVHIARTQWYKNTSGAIAASELSSVDFKDYEPLDSKALELFALHAYEELRARPDWSLHFETLEIGVRLDIGISPDKQNRRFFVNEITRWFGADFYSQMSLASDHQQLCREFANATWRYFQGGLYPNLHLT